MKKFKKYKAHFLCALYRLVTPHMAHKRAVLAEDLRKIGVYAIGLGLIAYIVGSDRITTTEAIYIEALGLFLWVIGLLFDKPKE